MSDKKTIWETYVKSWKVPSEEEKQTLFERSLDPGCRYTDPLATAQGFDELRAYMLDFHQQVPGGHFVTTYFLAHHQRCIARWNMVGGDGTVLGDGISYGEFGKDGKLTAMTGFFEQPGG